ncbi:hypothetical protein BT96DRAFT_973476 [Gymnopus androsaceus JB14]|uniref:Uncharacterized protein n=1 Tax=Gymnopus androsaceus JB14 TaxID=1447944 RepID=A0A6A4HWY9_9AGAR|nr:hypothetical protein BT96DRAFT_973476 [Gymnopus androsaceus JB14]
MQQHPEPRDREDFEQVAVEAIREASTNKVGLWSRIVSLVVGPRAPDNYVNAINMTLQARQELRYWRKVSNFWKKTAREENTNAGVPTPSSSNLSEVTHSSQRLFSSSSQKALRSSVDSQAKPSEKALGKRKAVDAYGSVNSMPSAILSFDSNVGQIGSSVVDSSSSNDSLSSMASFNSDTEVPTHRKFWIPPKSDETTHNSLKSAERALESFERICDRFSSGSNIGSLQSISEESSLFTTVPNAPRIVLNRSGESTGSLSSGRSSLIPAAAENVGLAPRNEVIHDADVTLVESGSEGSNSALAGQENDKTLAVIEVEGLVGKDSEEYLKVAPAPVDGGPSPLKKSRLPIFKIPSRLSQMSRMTSSSSKKSLSSFRSRNSSDTISTVASRDINRPRSVKHLVGFKPILPLRIIKRGRTTTSVHS